MTSAVPAAASMTPTGTGPAAWTRAARHVAGHAIRHARNRFDTHYTRPYFETNDCLLT